MLAALLTLLQEPQGLWRAWLETPGGALEFGLELARAPEGHWNGHLVNGVERIPVPSVHWDGASLRLELSHYDARVEATLEREGLVGSFVKRRSKDGLGKLPFRAARGARESMLLVVPASFAGRWAVDFSADDQPAVAVFEDLDSARARGTFLTATGDYRYLDGWREGNQLTLACFDGAHAFLFKAALQGDGSLQGDFWSGDWHHETWTARRDEAAALADPFAQTSWNGQKKLAELSFPDLDGQRRALAEFAGPVTLLVVFGSWCPNCNDEAALLAELDAKYRARGLRILLLAFELTEDAARDAEQVRIFLRRHRLELPAFLCGSADKAEATRALGLVDRLRAFPTTIFVGPDGLPKAIHSGFAGPATGAEHARLRAEFEARIERLLPPSAPGKSGE